MKTIKRQNLAAYGCLVIGKVYGRRLSQRPIGCTPALSVMLSAAAAAVAGFWRSVSVMPLHFTYVPTTA